MIEVPEDFDLIQFLQSLEAYYRSTKEVPNTVDQRFQQCNDALSILKNKSGGLFVLGITFQVCYYK